MSVGDGECEVGRFGNLNGNWGITEDTIGIALGYYAEDTLIWFIIALMVNYILVFMTKST